MGETEAGAVPRWGRRRKWQLEAEEETGSGILVQGSFHPLLRSHGREFSVWAFFVRGKDLLGYTGDLVEHHPERGRPTSVTAADHCWEMNPYFCIVLP